MKKDAVVMRLRFVSRYIPEFRAHVSIRVSLLTFLRLRFAVHLAEDYIICFQLSLFCAAAFFAASLSAFAAFSLALTIFHMARLSSGVSALRSPNT